MTTTRPRGRITYERLTNSLERLHGAIGAQLPDLKDAGRVRDLQQVITDALATARAGMSGETVPPPAQLKQDTKARIAEVHSRHDAVDEAAKHSQNNTHSALVFPAARDKHSSSLASSQQPPPKRTRGTRDTSKENAAPPAPPSSQHAARKPSAVRKTPIAARATRSTPSTTTSIKRNSKRTTRSATTRNLPAPPAQTDEADRRAAAAALLGLAEHSPDTSFTSFTSSLSGTTPSTTGKKRVHDAVFPALDAQARGEVDSAPPPKRRAMHAALPALEGVSVQRAFVLGVEYAVLHVSSGGSAVELRAWVEKGVGLQSVRGDERIKIDGGRAGARVVTCVGSGRPVVGGGKGFWDVV